MDSSIDSNITSADGWVVGDTKTDTATRHGGTSDHGMVWLPSHWVLDAAARRKGGNVSLAYL